MGAPREVETLVVGAGFSGLLAALKLKRAGRTNFVVVDKAPSVGGTWFANTYPGICCDVRSTAYLPLQYLPSFVPKRVFSTGEEILSFTRQLAAAHGLQEHLQLSVEVASATFDEKRSRWTVRTHQGHVLVCKFLVLANGPLSRPAEPNFEGLDAFRGEWCHSAEWDHSIDLRGKRVGVIGTGASAIQIIPRVAERAEHVHVFQRSAAYCWPRNDGPLPEEVSSGLLERGVPYIEEMRSGFNEFADDFVYDLYNQEERNAHARRMHAARVRSIVQDPATAEALIPDYPQGCKRALLSDDYLETFNKSNVTLVADTGGVRRVLATGVETADGRRIEGLDVLILATGFKTGPVEDIEIQGTHGTLNESYRERGLHSAFGMCSAGFPNLFMMLAPQSWTAHGNTSEACDIQSSWVVDTIEALVESGMESIEASAEAERWWNEQCTALAPGSVWARCQSWYTDAKGKPILWAGKWGSYVDQLRTRGPSSFVLRDAQGHHFPSRGVLRPLHVTAAQLPPAQRSRL